MQLLSPNPLSLILFSCLCALPLPAADTNVSRVPAAALAELTGPEKHVPFKEVIEATTHHRVLDFDTNNAAHLELQKKLLAAAAFAGERAAKAGLSAERANEAGNHIEPLVRAALREFKLDARVPVNSAGDAQVAGYPDIEIRGTIPCYLELKTYNAATAHTTQRTFYYSPSAHPKVTCDALHFLLGYELEKAVRNGETVFVPVRWKLITLQDLTVDLKFEFNQSNRELYRSDSKSLLAEGEVK